VIVLGGGLAEAGDELLLIPVREAFARRVTFHRTPEILRAELGDTAGCLGAALFALDSLGTP
jgi:glucokinase